MRKGLVFVPIGLSLQGMRLYITICVAVLLAACGENKQWTQGGTLHKARVKEWNKATTKNKMATLADMQVAIRQSNGFSYGNTGELKIDVEKLLKCVDERAKAADDTMKVSALAVECVVQFNADR